MTYRNKPLATLRFALKDINETLAIWDRNEAAKQAYLTKLNDERHAVLAELTRRQSVGG